MKRYVLFLVFMLTALAPIASYAQQMHYEEAVVSKIDVTAENLSPGVTFDPSAVLLRMTTKEGELFSQKDFDSDLKMLSAEYDRIEPSLSIINGKLYINLRIWSKPTIHTISWEGNEHMKASRLKKELGLSAGSIFDRDAFNKGLHKVKQHYVTKGYFEVEVSSTVTPHEGSNDVDIDIHIKEGRAGKIKKIVFDGFTAHEKEGLVELITTKPYSKFTSWLFGGGVYHEEAVEHDKLVILNFLHNEGYADASVTIDISQAPKDKDRIILTVTTSKGQLYHVGNVTFSGNELFDTATINKYILVATGQAYSPDKLHDTVRSLSDLYGAKGYIEAVVVYEPHLRHNEPIYDVHLTIIEGSQYKIGLVKIFGNVYTQNRVILHESLLIPGQVFDIRKLKATEERITNIGYFKNVNVYAVKSKDAELLGPNYRDVHIEVEESSTGNFMLFMGFSTLNNIFGGIELLEKNFNYKGLFDLFSEGPKALRGAGEYLRLKANIGSRSNSFVISWTKPYFHDTKWTVGFDLEKGMNRQQSDDYHVDTQGITLHATYPYNNYVRFPLHYRLMDSRTEVEGNAPEIEQQQSHYSGVISAVGGGIAYDSTNHPYYPTRGLLSRATTEIAGLGGDFAFIKVGYHNTMYMKMSQRGVMKYRADVDFMQPMGRTHSNGIPMGERFFMGGLGSVRGYRSYAIGPKFETTNDPTGGLSSALGSIEYNHKIVKMLDGFVFFDAGNISARQWKLSTFRAAWGFGARIDILKQFPLIVGMGYPVNAADVSDIRRFFMSIGGRF